MAPGLRHYHGRQTRREVQGNEADSTESGSKQEGRGGDGQGERGTLKPTHSREYSVLELPGLKVLHTQDRTLWKTPMPSSVLVCWSGSSRTESVAAVHARHSNVTNLNPVIMFTILNYVPLKHCQ